MINAGLNSDLAVLRRGKGTTSYIFNVAFSMLVTIHWA
jgi:hypothetical protein